MDLESKADIRQKYLKGQKITNKDLKGIRNNKVRSAVLKNEEKIRDAVENNTRLELLFNNEESGFLEAEGMEKTFKFTQNDISEASFSLELDTFGPYNIDYSKNGRSLLIGGRKGHVAAFDWKSGKLHGEIQVNETVRDVKWLHNENFYAVAQKKYVYIYDQTGLEAHQLTKHIDVTRMEFLPFHFLLATVGNSGYLHYQDTSTGQLVAEIATKAGRCDTLAQNPQNAVLHLGQNNGVVSLWSPNCMQPLVKVLCHKGKVECVNVDGRGQYMTTAGLDGAWKVWDLRMYRCLFSYGDKRLINGMSISQKGLVAVSSGAHINVYKDVFSDRQNRPYMTHLEESCTAENVKFCPFDDVLGIGHSKGFTSVLIPGSGEPNFDSLEANPFQTKKQKQEMEIRQLLDKLQPEMISLDFSDRIGQLNVSAKEQVAIEEKKPEPIKKRGRAKDAHFRKLMKKQQNIIDAKKEALKLQKKRQQEKEKKMAQPSKAFDPMDRFKRK